MMSGVPGEAAGADRSDPVKGIEDHGADVAAGASESAPPASGPPSASAAATVGAETADPRKDRCAGKRESILRAAAELFAAHDYHRVLVDDIADRAGVGKGTVYRYFETKEELFVAVLSYAVDLSLERLQSELHEVADPLVQLEMTCRQALAFFRANGHLYHVLHHENVLRSSQAHADIHEKIDRLRHFAEHILIDGMRNGVFEVDDAAFASTIFWAMIRTVLRHCSADEPVDELCGKVVRLFTRGVLARTKEK